MVAKAANAGEPGETAAGAREAVQEVGTAAKWVMVRKVG